MTCINCTKAIKKVLNTKEGIYKAVANFASEQVLVKYNSQRISLPSIKKAITDIGYEVVRNKKVSKTLKKKYVNKTFGV